MKTFVAFDAISFSFYIFVSNKDANSQCNFQLNSSKFVRMS